jgi:hypothetical protein
MDINQRILNKLDEQSAQLTAIRAEQAALATKIGTLVGNGQPGRVDKLESRMSEHDREIERFKGARRMLWGILTLGGIGEWFLHKVLK